MIGYAVRRIVQLGPVLLLVSFLVFMLIHIVPGDPIAVLMGEGNSDPVVEQALRVRLGLDRAVIEQYLRWLSLVLRGDFGASITTHQPVARMILDRLPATALLAGAAALVAIVISVPAGVIAAVRRNRPSGFLAMTVALLGISVPTFWLGVMLILIFSQWLGLLPSMGYVAPITNPVASLGTLVLPAITLGTALAANLARLVRTEVLEELGADYVRTARAKGLREWRVLIVHVLSNALIPMVTVLGLQIAGLLEGAVFVETVFAWPGVGRLAVTAVFERDYALVQGIVLLAAVLHVVMNLIVDVLYRAIDPRVALQ